MKTFTIMHTSDWHLGHMLYRRRRDEEFAAFLAWLEQTIKTQGVEALIIAGDVFDTAMPPPSAQKMYFDFLGGLGAAGVRHVVITAGNHDSPAFLTAPAGLLRSFNIHVAGTAAANPADMALILKDNAGRAELIVCAVPYLREHDLRRPEAGESLEEKEQKLLDGLREQYRLAAAQAEKCRASAGGDIPAIATGHLFASGAAPGEAVRDLYVGAMGRVPADIFGDSFDYIALGHLHRSQKVGGREHMRYSGSPLAMDFGETGAKSVTIVRFEGRKPSISHIDVPIFKRLERLRGSSAQILAQIDELARQNTANATIWLEIQHDGSDSIADLPRLARERARGACVEILCVKPARKDFAAAQAASDETLEDIDPQEMFRRLMADSNADEAEKERMNAAFAQLLREFYDSEAGE